MKSYRYARPEVLDQIPTDRHAVIEASAGTGKTFTLEHLVIELLLARGAQIEEILIVTFTEKATREMRQRIRNKIESILHPRPDDPRLDPEGSAFVIDDVARARLRAALVRFDRAPISTIHGFCQRVLKEHAFESGALFEQELVDVRSAFGSAFRREARIVLRDESPLSSALEGELARRPFDALEADLFGWFREPGIPMRDGEADEPSALSTLITELLPRVRQQMEGRKRRMGELDFDDLVHRLHEGVCSPAGAALVRALRTTYRYALVDEFQDTDPLQWGIFRRIFFESDAGHVLLVIGDPKQAIYGFRGADVHTYLEARAAIAEVGEVVTLVDNYRSTARVIDGYNRILERGFFEGAIGCQPVRCGDPSRRATDASGRELPGIELLHVIGEEGLKIDPIRGALADAAAREIHALVEGPDNLRFGARGEERPIGYADVHILVRTGTETVALTHALRRHGVPFAFFRQDGLFQTEEAGDLRDLLRAIEEPSDRSRRVRAWLTPFFALRLVDLTDVREVDESHPLLARLHRWRALANAHEYSELFRAIIEESGLARRELFLERSERRLTNYLHLIELLLQASHRRRRGLSDLIAELDAYIDKRASPPGESGNVQRLESEREAVQILTMHKAKGLEAAVVFLMGGFTSWGGRGQGPTVCHREGRREAWLSPAPKAIQAIAAREAREEDERLLYVALTRAKGRLYLPYFGPAKRGFDTEGLHLEYGRLKGCYRQLNTRLAELVTEGALEEEPALFGYRPIRVPARARETLAAVSPRSGAPGFVPPPELLAPLPDPARELHALRERHAGFVVTSYTQIKREGGGYRPPEAESEEFTTEADAPRFKGGVEGELPGGRSTGVFLHEVLEHIDFAAVRDADNGAEWGVREDVEALFHASARRNGVARRYLDRARDLVFRTLRARVELGSSGLASGLASVERRVAEMAFHFPIPETFHPRLDQSRPSPDGFPFEIERGLVRGVVDLVFEHEGKVYFLDWKSDRLLRYGPEALRQHVERNYATQAKFYGLGVLRHLDIRSRDDYAQRFGGILYCFLRGAEREPGPAFYFERPSFDVVLGWEEALRAGDGPLGSISESRSNEEVS